MIYQIGQVMLYVNNQNDAVKFWTEKAGFIILSEEHHEQGMVSIEIAPTKEAEASFVLHNKEQVAKMHPGLNLDTPSLILYTKNLDELYKNFSDQGVTVGEIVVLPSGRVFNFADNENNYFAVMEK